MGKVILVTSGKGGTGKTMFSVNLGGILAQTGRRVLLIDMDQGMRNMDLYLGLESRVVFNIVDVMNGICNLNKAILKVGGFESLYFIGASPRPADRSLTPGNMISLCRTLEKYFDHIIIDTGAGMGPLLDAAAAPATRAVIVAEPEIAALRDADTICTHLLDLGLKDCSLVINKVDKDLVQAGILMNPDTIRYETSIPLAGAIEWNRDIRISTSRGVPVICKDKPALRREFLKITGNILDESLI